VVLDKEMEAIEKSTHLLIVNFWNQDNRRKSISYYSQSLMVNLILSLNSWDIKERQRWRIWWKDLIYMMDIGDDLRHVERKESIHVILPSIFSSVTHNNAVVVTWHFRLSVQSSYKKGHKSGYCNRHVVREVVAKTSKTSSQDYSAFENRFLCPFCNY
jgi:hypothetical protein